MFKTLNDMNYLLKAGTTAVLMPITDHVIHVNRFYVYFMCRTMLFIMGHLPPSQLLMDPVGAFGVNAPVASQNQ